MFEYFSPHRLGATLGAVCLGLAALTQPATADPDMGRLFILGDSLSDGGTYSDGIIDVGGSPLIQNYRFTNNQPDGSARTTAEQFGELNGVTTNPFVINDAGAAGINGLTDGGTNFAQGGARVANPLGPGFGGLGGAVTTVPLLTQIQQAIGLAGGFAENDVVTITIGGNEFFFAPTPADLQVAAGQLGSGIRQLEAAGAKNIIIFNVPDLGQTPFGQQAELGAPGTAAALKAGTSAFNDLVKTALVGTRAVVFDAARLTQALIDDPAKYGFATGLATQLAAPGFEGTACEGAPDGGNSLGCIDPLNNAPASPGPFIFADGVHPSIETATIAAQAVQGLWEGAIGTSRMLETVQQIIRQSDLWRDERTRPAALFYLDRNGGWVKRDADDFRAIVIGEFSAADTDSTSFVDSGDATEFSGTVAADIKLGQNSLFGFELGLNRGEGDFANIDASWHSFGLGAYGMTMLFDGVYLNGAFGLDFINFDELDRTVSLGPSTETYEGDTEAHRLHFRIGAGASIPLGPNTLLSPEGAFAYDILIIDAYEESLGAASIAYGDNEIDSARFLASLALDTAPASMPGWSFSLRGGYEFEIEDEDRHDIAIGSDSGGLGELSFDRNDGSQGVVSGKIGRAIGPGVLSVGGGAILPSEGETGYTGSISFEMGL